jgi:xylulokinase
VPSPSAQLTVGSDIGTTSARGFLVDQDGNVMARTRIRHPVMVPSLERIEHDPRIAWRRAPRRILASLGHPAAAGIGITGMGPSLTAVNRRGVPEGPGLIYGDGRGDPKHGEAAGFLRALASEHPAAAGFWPAQTTAIVSLGGAPIIGELVAMMLWPLWTGSGWDEEVLNSCGATAAQMPAVRPEGAPAGQLDDAVIDSGSLDVSCERLMAGTIEPDEALVLCGSTLVMLMPVAGERAVPGIWTSPSESGTLATGASNAGALFLDWVDRVIAPGRQPPSPDRVPVWCPYIRGERTPWHDPLRRAALVDLNIAHDAGALRRGAFEASGFVVRHHLDLSGLAPRRIVAVGGGTAVAGWTQALADCTGVPVEIRGTGAGAAMGAAFMGRVAAGLENSTADAARWVQGGRTISPDPAWARPVRDRYRRFLDLAASSGEVARDSVGGDQARLNEDPASQP